MTAAVVPGPAHCLPLKYDGDLQQAPPSPDLAISTRGPPIPSLRIDTMTMTWTRLRVVIQAVNSHVPKPNQLELWSH